MNSRSTVAFIRSPRQLLQSDTGVPHFALDPLTYRCLLSLSPSCRLRWTTPPSPQWAKIITIKRTKDLNYFSLCAFNLFNTWVSQFELNYWNKWTFPQHSNLLRCTCICMCHKCYTICKPTYYLSIQIHLSCVCPPQFSSNKVTYCTEAALGLLALLFSAVVSFSWGKGEEESLKVGFEGPHKRREGGIPAGQRIRYCCQLLEKPRSAVYRANVGDREEREWDGA